MYNFLKSMHILLYSQLTSQLVKSLKCPQIQSQSIRFFKFSWGACHRPQQQLPQQLQTVTMGGPFTHVQKCSQCLTNVKFLPPPLIMLIMKALRCACYSTSWINENNQIANSCITIIQIYFNNVTPTFCKMQSFVMY